MFRIYFDFFLKVADIVCAIIVRCRDFNGFSVNFQRLSLAGACTQLRAEDGQNAVLHKLTTVSCRALADSDPATESTEMNYFSVVFSDAHKSHLIETFFLVIAL